MRRTRKEGMRSSHSFDKEMGLKRRNIRSIRSNAPDQLDGALTTGLPHRGNSLTSVCGGAGKVALHIIKGSSTASGSSLGKIDIVPELGLGNLFLKDGGGGKVALHIIEGSSSTSHYALVKDRGGDRKVGWVDAGDVDGLSGMNGFGKAKRDWSSSGQTRGKQQGQENGAG